MFEVIILAPGGIPLTSVALSDMELVASFIIAAVDNDHFDGYHFRVSLNSTERIGTGSN